MLPLSANPDFLIQGTAKVDSEYRDINGDDLSIKSEIYGTDALDQAIEAVIVTEPYERLFNVDFWSPFYRLLFNNTEEAESVVNEVFDKIEQYVNIMIDRKNAKIDVSAQEHSVSFILPYRYILNGATVMHTFSRVISA